jgi:hypothetical protein
MSLGGILEVVPRRLTMSNLLPSILKNGPAMVVATLVGLGSVAFVGWKARDIISPAEAAPRADLHRGGQGPSPRDGEAHDSSRCLQHQVVLAGRGNVVRAEDGASTRSTGGRSRTMNREMGYA